MTNYSITIEYTHESGYVSRVKDRDLKTVARFQGNSSWQDAHAMAANWIRKQGVKR